MAAETNGAAAAPPSPHSRYQLDIAKLHSLPSEQQDLYLLTFTSDLARHVEELDADGASAEQIYIKKEILQVVTLQSPAPTRVIRNNLGRSFAGIFQKGNRKLLYDSINDLVAIASTGAGAGAGKEKDLRARHAAVHCLGTVFEAAGDSAITLSALTCAAVLRVLKIASSHAGLRSAVYRALGRVVRGIGDSIDEQVARDIWKSARNAAPSDKALLVQQSACWCLEQFVSHTSYFDNSNDFEKLQTSVWKTIDSHSIPVRHAAASCLAAILVKSFSESPNRDAILKLKKPKKAKKSGPAGEPDEEIERTSSPVLSKPITALSYSLPELLKQLSLHYSRPATSNRARAGLAVCYKYLLTSLGESVVERHYGEVATHFFLELLNHPSLTFNRYRTLMTRRFVRVLLQDVVQSMLGESAQLNAARYLLNDVIKDYPQVIKERPEPSKQTLTAALSALASLIKRLDASINSISELCREALLQVLQHPSYTVQVHASRAMRTFVIACPQQLLPTLTICMNTLTREIGFLGTQRAGPRRCVGYANGLAAALSASNNHPLHGSVDVYARVLAKATELLKSSAGTDLRVSSTQIQIAWIMIGALMPLGPNFVKIHLSQLLLLWKNALPPPLPNMGQRTMLELSFLAHVRECALASISSFLTYNSKLLTSDVSKRLAAMLQNTAHFLSNLPEKKTSEELHHRLSPALQLVDFDLMVRRRVFQCYTTLVASSPHGASEIAVQSNILPLAVASFADPDRYGASSFGVAIASSAGNFENIWSVGDNFGFGVNGLMRGLDYEHTHLERNRGAKHWTATENAESMIDATLLSPIGAAWEHDSTTSYINPIDSDNDIQPQPPATEVVNTAIGIFALVFPLQSPKIQESILEQVSSFLTSMAAQKDSALKAALTANVALALLITLKVTNGESAMPACQLQSASAEKRLTELLHTFVVDPDQSIRFIAAEALGRLCSVCGNDLTARQVQQLIDLIVSNREPHARSGCALALACIHSQLGGMAAGFHLRNIIGILMSLAADQHPVVHYWALESLCKVVDSAGLTFSGYVSSTIGLLGQLYVFDSHNEETAAQASSDLELALPTVAVNARCIDSIINVLGPDLQDMAKPRDMMLTLIRQFQTETDPLVLVESTRCLGDLAVYAPGHMEFEKYVKGLQADLDSASIEIRNVAIDGLANLMRRDTEGILRTAKPGLEEKLWDLLDQDPDQAIVKGIFTNWLSQTGLADTAGWVQRINSVLTKAKSRIDDVAAAASKSVTAGPDLQDEEVAGFAAAAGTNQDDQTAPTSSQELMRWQVRLFAMDLLNEHLSMIAKDVAANEESVAADELQARVADVVRIAFSGSTAGVVELRVKGLKLIDQILKLFGATPDPDFTEAMLLEQYQAQISSALTPAFAADSSPELAAEAVNVCATFISTGIVTDVDRMGRILKTLVSALQDFSVDHTTASIGELKGLSPNAQVMVRMAVLSAWAGLQIASAEQKYLVNVVKPHVARLTPLWLSSLSEYARLRFEPDGSSSAGPSDADPEQVYAAFSRETLLKFYQDTWLNLVDAIASLIDEDSEFVFDALDGKLEPPTTDDTTLQADREAVRPGSGINYRSEPVAFFFVLFGLAFEALVQRPSSDSAASKARVLEILLALRKILRPSVSGNAVYQEVVFNELMDALDRMCLTEGLDVQSVIVSIAGDLCVAHPSARPEPEHSAELSDDIDQLFELTRIIVLVLAGIIPGLSENAHPSHAPLSDEAVQLATLSLTQLVSCANVFPSIIKSDLHACIFNIFVVILSSPICQATLVPQAMPIFRRFVASLSADMSTETKKQVRNTFSRFLLILKNAQKREFEQSVAAEKNALLAGTMLITAAPWAFTPDDALLARFAAEVSDCLNNRMTTKMAGGCARSLLLVPGQTDIKSVMAARLLPSLISFVAVPGEIEGTAETRVMVAQALTSFASSFDPERRAAANALVIPALLARAQNEGENVHGETASRLLELAASDAMAFRAVVGRLDAEQKGFMQDLLSKSQGAKQERVEEKDQGQPSIALKMEF